jgi:hypothetical protein
MAQVLTAPPSPTVHFKRAMNTCSHRAVPSRRDPATSSERRHPPAAGAGSGSPPGIGVSISTIRVEVLESIWCRTGVKVAGSGFRIQGVDFYMVYKRRV